MWNFHTSTFFKIWSKAHKIKDKLGFSTKTVQPTWIWGSLENETANSRLSYAFCTDARIDIECHGIVTQRSLVLLYSMHFSPHCKRLFSKTVSWAVSSSSSKFAILSSCESVPVKNSLVWTASKNSNLSEACLIVWCQIGRRGKYCNLIPYNYLTLATDFISCMLNVWGKGFPFLCVRPVAKPPAGKGPGSPWPGKWNINNGWKIHTIQLAVFGA